MRRPVIGVMGANEASPGAVAMARRLGHLVASAGWILLTGGRPNGVMEAASAGAKTVPGSLTLGILPTGPDGAVSMSVDIAVFTGLGDARNAINVLSSDVVIACGVEGPGTASEVALALKSRRPTILLAAAPAAAAFYHSIAPPGRLQELAPPGRLQEIVPPGLLHEVATPEAAVLLIERELGIPRCGWAT